MSVNFCRQEFQPKISTSTVCTDGYGVDNLINFNSFRGGWKGFMAESFIKPPVDITIEFPVNICIDKIVLDPSVGRQKSCGFEIYSATVWQGDGKNDKKFEPISTRIANTLIPCSSTSQSTRMVRFINSSYRSSFPDIARLSPQKHNVTGPDDVERFLRMSSPGAVVNMNRLTIRITRSYNGSVLALRSVEVWGEPSRRISRQSQLKTLEIIHKLYAKQHVVPSKQKASSLIKDRTSSSKSALDSNSKLPLKSNEDDESEEARECPEDFLDPITCQMMILPVLLPSGKTIDRSTLEKHNKTEAVWGRPPNDPFTGVAFTSKSQPVPNVKLKTRLDQYLLTSGDKHKSMARDVGRASTAGNSMGPSTSTLLMPKRNVAQTSIAMPQSEHNHKLNTKHRNLPAESFNKASTQFPSTHAMQNGTAQNKPSANLKSTKSKHNLPQVSCNSSKSNIYHPNKRKRTANFDIKLSSIPQSQSLEDNKRVKLAVSSTGGMQKSAARFDEKKTGGIQTDMFKSHEDSVTDSLDDALNQALGSLPSFSSASSHVVSSVPTDLNNILSSASNPSRSCAVCHAELNTALIGHKQPAVTLYRLPCTHFICRNCLMDKSGALNQQDTRFCASCGRTYRKEDVVRVHL